MKIIAITNQKGGVGKTTTAINLAAYLANNHLDTLLIDLDPQGNATSGLGINAKNLSHSLYDVLINDTKLVDIIIPTTVDWLDIIPAHDDLIGLEVQLVTELARETRLKFKIRELPENIYQYIIVDCPPSLGLLTINALTAVHSALIPIQCEYYALEGVRQLKQTINRIHEFLNPALFIEGILLTLFDRRANLSLQVVDEVKKHFGTKVYETIIPRNIKLAEAPSFGQSILTYAPHSTGAEAYEKLAYEIIHTN